MKMVKDQEEGMFTSKTLSRIFLFKCEKALITQTMCAYTRQVDQRQSKDLPHLLSQ